VTPRELARRLGAEVVERRGGITPYRYVVSELETRRRRIVIYRDTIELLARLVRERSLPFECERLDDIAILHECAHLRHPRAREEGAHRYAQRLLRLSASPQILSDALAAFAAGADR